MPSPLSVALVVAQFVLIALLLSPLATLLPARAVDLPGAALLFGALALALWALSSMRRRTFTVMPEPRAGSRLVTHGPYAHVRHPMYTAVLLAGLGAAWLHARPADALWWALLAVVMIVKLRHEERLLLAHHPGYANYRDRTAALLPGVY